MRTPMIEHDDGSYGPDLPDGFRGRARLTDEGDYELTDEGGNDARLAAVEAAVDAAKGLAENANATAQQVAKAMRDANPGQGGGPK